MRIKKQSITFVSATIQRNAMNNNIILIAIAVLLFAFAVAIPIAIVQYALFFVAVLILLFAASKLIKKL